MAKPGSDPLVGKRIREYEILEILGKGGMGAVYRARHVYLDEERAIKVIQSRLAGDKDFVDRFIREAKILTRLRHPNLVLLYEFGTLEEDIFFMVLEFLRGESVLERIHRRTRVPIPESVRIIREAALGLQSAHSRGIIHRDISPDNLLLVQDENGNEVTKVIDFGIAKPNFESTHHITVTNLFIGKPEYSSPEQCGMMEEGELIDRRTDVYSLGITLYYMLVGKLPFYSATPQGYLLKHASETPKPVSAHFPPDSIPPELDRVVLKALAKKRDERYSSMDDLVRDLDQLLPSESETIGAVLRPEKRTSELHPGDLFSRRYMIEKKLGEGGMGIVYKAVDKILEVPVALKIMNARVVGDPKTLERFKREVILARKVAHPNACRIFDIGETGGVHYVSMEFLKGTTLSQMIIDHGKLDADVGVPIMKQVCLALQEAHRVGIVHRDLKPQNIMVDLELRAYIMDFGISISKDASRVTQTGVLIGTPAYMAPEQFEGKNVDHRTDIYSLGVIMYEMFTGQLPFDATSPMAMIFAHLKSTPVKPSELAPGLPQELEEVVMKCLEKEPATRYQDTKDLMKALDGLMVPGTGTFGFSQEALAHKLIAERNYSKAVKLLSTLVKNNPGNTQWKRLLQHASAERIKKDLRRAKSLIRKKNLIQAQLLIERINRVRPDSKGVTLKVRKLETMLQKRRKESIEFYLSEAEKFLEQKDYSSGMASIEAASNLNPASTQVSKLEERFVTLQRQILHESLTREIEIAKGMIEAGQESEAQDKLEAILKGNPSFEPAAILVQELRDAKQLRLEKEKIEEALPRVAECISRIQMEGALSEMDSLKEQVSRLEFVSEIDRISIALQDISNSLSQSAFEKIGSQLDALTSNDPLGWLGAYRREFSELGRFANQEVERQNQWKVAQQLFESGDLEKARDKIKAFLKAKPGSKAAQELQDKIQKAIQERDEAAQNFKKASELGRSAYEQLRYEDAVSFWQEALQIRPADESARQWLSLAQSRITAELKVRGQIESDLNQVQELIGKNQWNESQKLMDAAEKRFAPEFRLDEFRGKLAELKKIIAQGRERQGKIERQLNGIDSLRTQGKLHEALHQLHALAKSEPELKELKSLESELHDAIQQTQQKLEKWLASQITRIETLIRNKDFEAAVKVIAKAETEIPVEYFTSAFKTQIQDLKDKVDAADQKERTRQFFNTKLGEALQDYTAGNLNQALEKVDSVLKQNPEMTEALDIRTEILNDLDRQQKFKEAVQKGENSYKAQKWSDALFSWNQALELYPEDSTVLKSVEVAKKQIADETAARQNIEQNIQQCRSLILDKDFAKAEKNLHTAKNRIGSIRNLQDLNEQIQSVQKQLREAIDREEEWKGTIQKKLTEVHDLYGRGLLDDANRHVDSLLQKDPTLTEAVNLQTTIQAALQERNALLNVSNAIQQLVQDLSSEKLQDVQNSLTKLKNAAAGTSMVEGVAFVLSEIQAIVSYLQSLDWQSAASRLQSMISKSRLVQPYSERLHPFLTILENRHRQAVEISHIYQEAIQKTKNQQWEAGVQLMEQIAPHYEGSDQFQKQLQSARENVKKLETARGKLRKAYSDVQSRAQNRKWDEAIRIGEEILKQNFGPFALQEERLLQQKQLSDVIAARTQATLEDASNKLEKQDFEKAAQTFKKVLSWEPENQQAKSGLIRVQQGLDEKAAAVREETMRRAAPLPVREEIVPLPPAPIPAPAPVPVQKETVIPTPQREMVEPPVWKKYWWAAIPVVVILGLIIWYLIPSPAPQPGFVRVNALPWAKVTIIPADQKIALPEIPENERTTPCYLVLPEGDYTLELQSSVIPEPAKIPVKVEAGKEVAVNYAPKDYDATNILKALGETK